MINSRVLSVVSVDSLGGACELIVDSGTVSLMHRKASPHSGRELGDVASQAPALRFFILRHWLGEILRSLPCMIT